MSILRRVRSIRLIYTNLEKEIRRAASGLEIFCPDTCGMCCEKKDIEATPLEFLPLAMHWFETGIASDKLAELKERQDGVCICYKNLGGEGLGRCSEYENRGLICRLFGYSVNPDRRGSMRLLSCRIIKDSLAARGLTLSSSSVSFPVMTNWYKKLIQIEFSLGNQYFPINTAIIKAIETVLAYYAYRPYRKRKPTKHSTANYKLKNSPAVHGSGDKNHRRLHAMKNYSRHFSVAS
ncbi:YkgJ family cysteine cluster protein [Myxococcota bacterium]|nr:YkgJ family cysteine cluster protein [Myxococcota bacterium]MBU1380595.1 YkgJ family cysteine cluster protein [Myxococcota bacterium]MBU1497744.1 YkgJ family cysteine cluster protein [Myxococcota bacterium]